MHRSIVVLLTLTTSFWLLATDIQAQCTYPFTSVTEPLSDRTTPYTYYPDRENPSSGSVVYSPGLFPHSQNQAPANHRSTGQTQAAAIQPLNDAGQSDPNGKIGLISIGMSNTSQVFGPFRDLSNNLAAKNPHLTIANTAVSGAVAESWDAPSDYAWTSLESRLSGLDRNQVQIIWVKLALAGPQDYPDHLNDLFEELVQVVHTAKSQLPNLKIAFISSRTRSYDVNGLNSNQHGLNSEPYAFEGGLTTRTLITEQINNPTGRLNLTQSPYLTWGPYLWIDGLNVRSDGLTWLASDLESDCTHPSITGRHKAGQQIFNFFVTHPLTTSWFLDNTQESTSFTINPSATTVAPGQTVSFNHTAPANTNLYWYFDDGLTSQEWAPTKSFSLPGTYTVSAVAIEANGTFHRAQTPITVTDSSPTSTPNPFTGDLDNDGDTDFLDALALLFNFSSTSYPGGDYNHNGRVDIFDVSTLISNL